MKPDEICTFADADADADRFEAILKRLGIKIANGSSLEHALLLWRAFADAHRELTIGNLKPDLGLDENQEAVLAVGGLAIVEMVLRHQDHPKLASLGPHLHLLNGRQPFQTLPSPPNDDASNKVLELAIALSAMGLTEDIGLDDPVASSGGRNPDVLAVLDGRCWGFACKAIHGAAPATLDDRMVEAVEQIERSKAEVGVVVISFKNRVPAYAWFRDANDGPYPGRDAMMARWSEFAHERVKQMVEHATKARVLETFEGKKALPGLLVVHDAVGVVSTHLGPVLTRLSPLQFVPFTSPKSDDLAVINRLNEARQGVL